LAAADLLVRQRVESFGVEAGMPVETLDF
jgi:hypothetical protein